MERQNDDAQRDSHWVPASDTVTCKRGGKKDLAWQHSKRTKKFYLCVTRRSKDGALEADRRGFHQCQPARINLHGVEVSDFDIPF
jgi:hypothetical protein